MVKVFLSNILVRPFVYKFIEFWRSENSLLYERFGKLTNAAVARACSFDIYYLRNLQEEGGLS